MKKSIAYTDSLTLSHAQNIFTLEFSALSFASPTRSRYRYRLEGLETHWNEAAATHRVVTYTTLPAAEYRFHVQSKDDPWRRSEPGLTLAIRVLPAWWNTWQFRTVWITSLFLLTWFVYRLRLHRMQREFEVRLEERVEERTRIARELHDTLLQTVQGFMLGLQAVNEMMPPGAVKNELEQTLEVGDRAIAEGRKTVQDLRSVFTTSDLAEAVRAVGEELASGDAAAFRVVVEGPVRI